MLLSKLRVLAQLQEINIYLSTCILILPEAEMTQLVRVKSQNCSIQLNFVLRWFILIVRTVDPPDYHMNLISYLHDKQVKGSVHKGAKSNYCVKFALRIAMHMKPLSHVIIDGFYSNGFKQISHSIKSFKEKEIMKYC